jgi:hypothetical protein
MKDQHGGLKAAEFSFQGLRFKKRQDRDMLLFSEAGSF